jgi:hypothetical protein
MRCDVDVCASEANSDMILFPGFIDVGEWSASHLGRFTLGGRSPHYTCIGGWVGLGASLDATE